MAITPFLLNSQGGPFDIFSFVKSGKQTKYYEVSAKMEKTKGQPLLEAVQGIATKKITDFQKLVKAKDEDHGVGKVVVVEFIKLFF